MINLLIIKVVQGHSNHFNLCLSVGHTKTKTQDNKTFITCKAGRDCLPLQLVANGDPDLAEDKTNLYFTKLDDHTINIS